MEEIVLPTVHEMRANPQSRRHAYLACIVTFAMKDHLKKSGEVHVHETMAQVGLNAFQLVRSVANGSKHVAVDGTHRIPFRAGDDYLRPPARAGVMRAGVSRLGDTIGGREVATDGGRRDIVLSVLNVVRAYGIAYPARFPDIDFLTLARKVRPNNVTVL